MSTAEVKHQGKNKYTQRQKSIQSINIGWIEREKTKVSSLILESYEIWMVSKLFEGFHQYTNTYLEMNSDCRFQKLIMSLIQVFCYGLL